MIALRKIGVLLWLLSVAVTVAAEPALTVMQDGTGRFNGNDERPIQAAIDAARVQGGGRVVIGGGNWLLRSTLRISSVTNLTISGSPGRTVLRLPPLANASLTSTAAAGADSLYVYNTVGFTNGMQLHVCAPGKIHKFTGKPEPYFLARVARVEPYRLVVAKPLEFPAPAGTRVYPENEPNIFRVNSGSSGIVIENLTLDGGRRDGDPSISGHVVRCGVLAEGAYTYEGSPSQLLRGITVRRCIIRSCFGRGVAMYAVNQGRVERCVIQDTVDEAIDFDHFTTHCRANRNDITRCRIGMELNDANDCLVRSNRFYRCGVGINLWRWCRQPELNVRNQIIENQFFNTEHSVLSLGANTASNVVRGNIVTGCGGTGIMLAGEHQKLIGNTIRGARGTAIVVSGNDNEISGNRCGIDDTTNNRKAKGFHIKGHRNYGEENVVEAKAVAGAQPLHDEGKENKVQVR